MSAIALICFLVLAMAERFYERRYSFQAIRGERKMEWSFLAFHTLHVLIYLGTAIEFFVVQRPLHWGVSGVGLVLFAVSLVVRLTAIRTLGQFWSLHLEIREGHELVTGGIYRYVRHPAYSAIMLEVVSVPLVGNAYYTLGFALALYVPLLLLRWGREEQEMIAKFGEKYSNYRRQVPAFIPIRLGRQR